MRCSISVALLAMAGFAAGAAAQTYEQGGARLEFQVFDPALAHWTSTVNALPGQQVEWRIRLSYTGTRTDLHAPGEAIYQPVISNTDNSDDAGGMDTLGPWRNGGITGWSIPGTMVTAAEGDSGAPLASYGRVNYGLATTTAATSNIITTFRHSNGGDGAPAGTHLRVAGNFIAQWPRDLSGPVPPLDVTTTDIRNIIDGVHSGQGAHGSSSPHVEGLVDMVTFRGAILLSASPGERTLQISTFRDSIRRVGGSGANESDDRRYFAWQTGIGDIGTGTLGHRTLDPEFNAAEIHVIPAPAGLACAVIGAGLARRRRGQSVARGAIA